jgi:hypothetical protein
MSPPIYKECYTQYIEKKTDMPTHKHQDELALPAKTFSRARVFKVHAIGEESLGTPVCSAIYIRILTVGLLLELQTICCLLLLSPPPFSFSHTLGHLVGKLELRMNNGEW